jgi:hypothetical protein
VLRARLLGGWWKDCCTLLSALVGGNKVSSSSEGAVSAANSLLTFFLSGDKHACDSALSKFSVAPSAPHYELKSSRL